MNKRIKISIIILFAVILLGLLFSILFSRSEKLTSSERKSEAIPIKIKEPNDMKIDLKFDKDIYFWGRTSAVDYSVDGSGRSNKDADSHDYLDDVSSRIDSILLMNPTLKAHEIESIMVNGFGNKMIPEITIDGAKNQVARIAKARNISVEQIDSIITEHVENRLIGCLGPKTINVIMLNAELDTLDK